VLAWAFIVIGLLGAVLSLFTARSTVSDHVQGTVLICVLAWFVLLVGVTPRIVVRDAGLVVVSWFVRWDIPWSAVRSVAGSNAVVITLTDGRAVSPSVGGASLLSRLTGNRTQRRMVAAIEVGRRAVGPPATTTAVRRKVDLLPVPFVVVLVSLIILTVVVHGAH
jgi:hypothetical protein